MAVEITVGGAGAGGGIRGLVYGILTGRGRGDLRVRHHCAGVAVDLATSRYRRSNLLAAVSGEN